MKKIIKWLADVSGVTSDIESKAFEDIGHSIKWNSYWFSAHPKIMKVLYEYGNQLAELRHTGVDIEGIRTEYLNKNENP